MNPSDPSTLIQNSPALTILKTFTVDIFQTYQELFRNQINPEELDWIKKTQEQINEYINEFKGLSGLEIAKGIKNLTFVRIQEHIIINRLRKLPKHNITVDNLFFQKLSEIFSLHNQLLMEEWGMRSEYNI